ncbi:MAG TPA: SDR family NAD(P)-dependent oxidoreductase [Acidimicrobiales bacterium]|jgi:NAD(P)-dependent dehydrogenase (short-subunit alcohol dehydrogenase family)|nr:SDR family NAD(P)-dependent oxidoreductase [Acidimicrobiales bacterium]
MKVSGTSAVVIGGGSGVGRGIALGLAAAGARVVVGDIDPSSADEVRNEIESAGGLAVSARVDSTERDSLDSLASVAEAEHGGVQILASNVGVLTSTPLDRASERDWSWSLELNVLSHVRAVDVFLPHLRAGGPPAHIVLTASLAAVYVPPTIAETHLGVYTATKHAVLGYGETLRNELEPESIGVSVLCPGMVQSNLVATSARHRPERHGGPFTPAMPAASDREQTQLLGMLPPEAVGPVVVRGIEANRAHILTHPYSLGLIEERHGVLVDDFRFFAEPPPG